MKSAISPSQKTGAEIPKSAKPIAPRSTSGPPLDRGEHADRDAEHEPDGGGARRSARASAAPARRSRSCTEHVVAVGVAEPGPAVLVAGDEVLDEVAVLDRRTACRGAAAGGSARAGPAVGDLPANRSAGSPFGSLKKTEERDEQDDDDDDDRPDEAAGDVDQHLASLQVTLRGARGRPGDRVDSRSVSAT